MKRIALAFSVFVIWFALAGSYYVCVIKGFCDNLIEETSFDNREFTTQSSINEIKESQSNLGIIETDAGELTRPVLDTLYSYPLEIYYANELITDYERNFLIKQNDTVVIIPEGLTSFNQTIKSKIKESDTILISIYSYYNISEDSTIAIGRANYIKEKLKEVNITEEMIVTELQQTVIGFDENDTFEGGIEVNIALLDEEGLTENKYTTLDKEGVLDTVENDEEEAVYNEIRIEKPKRVSYTVETEKYSVVKNATIIEKESTEIKTIVQKININKPAVKKVNKSAVKNNVVFNESEVRKGKLIPEKNTEITQVVENTSNQVLNTKAVVEQPKSKIIIEEQTTVEKEKAQTIKPELKKVRKPKVVSFIKTITIANTAFKGTKLKEAAEVKNFITDYKKGQLIYLTGFSNESHSTFDNYQYGLALANSVKGCLKKEGIGFNNIIINAKKQPQGSNVEKGVILQLK